LFERYLQPIGIIQAGVFYKDLRNPIYAAQSTVAAGTFAGFSQSQPINGPRAHIGGIEAAWQQHLGFLPGLLGGIGVAANYSWTTSKAIVPGRTDRPRLVRQGPNNWNFGLTYDKARFSMRFGITHNDAYIYSYNYNESNAGPFNFLDGSGGGLKGPNGDQYLYAHTQFDAQASYRLGQGVQMIVSMLICATKSSGSTRAARFIRSSANTTTRPTCWGSGGRPSRRSECASLARSPIARAVQPNLARDESQAQRNIVGSHVSVSDPVESDYSLRQSGCCSANFLRVSTIEPIVRCRREHEFQPAGSLPNSRTRIGVDLG
jgi:hypothetical protein